MRSLAKVAAIVIAMALATVTTPASAAPTDEADVLFEDGRKLMDAGSVAEACKKFERSFQLAPRLGTMLNLGSCFERNRQLARALTLYERAATLARQLGRADREAAARELAVALEPKVAKVLVVDNDDTANLVIQVDGETLSTFAGLVPLDPGERRFVARAPGKAPYEAKLALEAGKTTTVTIPKLKDEPRAAPAAARPAEEHPKSTARTVALASGLVVTAAGIGLGTFFGLRAGSKHDASAPFCDAAGCTQHGLDLVDSAQSAGNVSTGAFIAGGVALAATVIVFLASRSSTPSRARAER